MKKILFLFVLLQSFSFFSTAQTSLSGKVIDAESGEELIGANVILEKNGVFVTGTATDFNGDYRLYIDPGTYDIKVTSIGYPERQITGVVVKAGQTNVQYIIMPSGGLLLDEVVVTEYKIPIVEPDHTYSGPTLTSEQIRNLPTRKVSSLAATTAGLSQVEEGDAVTMRSSRTKATDYYIDGIRVRETGTMIPVNEIPQLEVITGGLPAAYGSPLDFNFEHDLSSSKDIRTEITKTTSIQAKKESKIDAGILTAGEWNGLHNWIFWTNQLNTQDSRHQQDWKLFPSQRYSVQVTNVVGFPIPDCTVKLLDDAGKIVWQAKTDNLGKAELWANLFEEKTANFSIIAESGKTASKAIKAISFEKNINKIQLPVNCQDLKNLDIAFVVDATGSMRDEINYLKAELRDVINQVSQDNESLNIRTASVFYRDTKDEYITRSVPFSNDLDQTLEFMSAQSAAGGGDFPEAVDAALEETLNLEWRDNTIARILFLVLDAPPHAHALENIQKQIRKAATLGIRIVPITASGINPTTEFLMKTLAIISNGSYVFITDHSGVGNAHLEATVSAYNVEMLNDLMVRLISEFSEQEGCNTKGKQAQQQFASNFNPINQGAEYLDQLINFYPNPADKLVFVELKEAFTQINVINIVGKIVRTIEQPQAGTTNLKVSDLPAGTYLLQFKKGVDVITKRLIVAKP